MFLNHQDIDSTLVNVLKNCTLRLASGSEEIIRKLDNYTGSYKKTCSPDEMGFLPFLPGLICFALLLVALFPDKKTMELTTSSFSYLVIQ